MRPEDVGVELLRKAEVMAALAARDGGRGIVLGNVYAGSLVRLMRDAAACLGVQERYLADRLGNSGTAGADERDLSRPEGAA